LVLSQDNDIGDKVFFGSLKLHVLETAMHEFNIRLSFNRIDKHSFFEFVLDVLNVVGDFRS
jgi:hypothetical protein